MSRLPVQPCPLGPKGHTRDEWVGGIGDAIAAERALAAAGATRDRRGVSSRHREAGGQRRGRLLGVTPALLKGWRLDLASIRVPVLVTYGDDDTSLPVAHGHFLTRAVPERC